jgi:uncharacterized protein (TIGR03083 family)
MIRGHQREMTRVRALARREREEFAEVLCTLTAQQWGAASRCAGWSVRDVAAHTIAYLGQSLPGLTANMIRARGNVDRLNAQALPALSGLSPAQLVDLMYRGTEPSGAGGLYGSRVALIECLVHQQDIRRPLGLDRVVAEEALQAALGFARVSPVIGGARRTRGVRLVATDMDWSAGKGHQIHGPGEALLMVMTGRVAAVRDELDGEGLPLLR